jgi:hypothetical protein
VINDEKLIKILKVAQNYLNHILSKNNFCPLRAIDLRLESLKGMLHPETKYQRSFWPENRKE